MENSDRNCCFKKLKKGKTVKNLTKKMIKSWM